MNVEYKWVYGVYLVYLSFLLFFFYHKKNCYYIFSDAPSLSRLLAFYLSLSTRNYNRLFHLFVVWMFGILWAACSSLSLSHEYTLLTSIEIDWDEEGGNLNWIRFDPLMTIFIVFFGIWGFICAIECYYIINGVSVQILHFDAEEKRWKRKTGKCEWNLRNQIWTNIWYLRVLILRNTHRTNLFKFSESCTHAHNKHKSNRHTGQTFCTNLVRNERTNWLE